MHIIEVLREDEDLRDSQGNMESVTRGAVQISRDG